MDLDVEASQARIWCFADSEHDVRALEQRVVKILEDTGSGEHRQITPTIRAWNEEHHRYVDPAVPEEDPDTREVWIYSDLEPHEVKWRVRLELTNVFEISRVRRQLPELRRPVIAEGNRHVASA